MEYYSYGHSSISETLDIVERGFERLGIPLNGIVRLPEIAPQPDQDLKPFAEVTPEMIGKMIRLNGLGYSQLQIARDLGCAQSTVCKNLRRLGYARRPGRSHGAATHAIAS